MTISSDNDRHLIRFVYVDTGLDVLRAPGRSEPEQLQLFERWLSSPLPVQAFTCRGQHFVQRFEREGTGVLGKLAGAHGNLARFGAVSEDGPVADRIWAALAAGEGDVPATRPLAPWIALRYGWGLVTDCRTQAWLESHVKGLCEAWLRGRASE